MATPDSTDASDDEFFAPEWERFVAHERLAIEPIEIPGGHFSMIEDPDALAQLLGQLAPCVTPTGRPKGMHRPTYEQLRERYWDEDDFLDRWLLARLTLRSHVRSRRRPSRPPGSG